MPANGSDGPTRMRALAAALPQQLSDGYRAGRSLDTPVSGNLRSAALIGMGGSAIAGDLAATLLGPETELGWDVVRSPELPRAVDDRGLVIVASYSGETWETLTAYAEAGKRGAKRIVATSGGRLAERAADDGVPCLLLPPGGPPRAWVGFMLGGLLGALDPVFPESNEDRLDHAVETLRDRIGSYASAQGPAVRLAKAIGARRPAVYAETGFAGLARRWKTQIEENAKRGAEWDVIPELFHNALVAWDAAAPSEGRGRAVVQLEWSETPTENRDRYRYLAKLLTARKVPAVRVPLEATDRLHALVLGLSLGDYVSLELAARAHVDPYPVDAITTMKRTLEKRASPARRRAAR